VRIGLPAIVDRSAGIVLGATAFGWSRVLFRDELVQRLGDQVPYGLSLDRLAGHAIRAERDASDLPVSAGLVLLFGHAGIGGSFQQGGHTLQGDFDAGAQFGHITVDPDGRQCWCGRRGCLERYAGVGALANTLAGEPERQTLGPAIPVAATLERVATADDEVVAAVQGQAKWLARGLDIITAALGPSEIVFGGNLPHLMPFLENELAQHRSRLRPLGSGPMPRVRTSVLGVDAVARGGIARAIDDVLERPWMLSPDPLVADRRGVRQLTP
jgi:predicted NBD/HSP70 family sugar kinase